jgi:dipeptidase D
VSILDFFVELSKVPRCSGNRDKFIEYFRFKALEYGYECSVDRVGNIYCKRGNPQICLQAHYDMVCIGDCVETQIEIYEHNGYLKAKNSTLGADNGIAIAYILKLMLEKKEIEVLLTSDEEIGLIGAFGLEHDIESKYILNLDTEEEAEVYMGCAGGVDLVATKQCNRVAKREAHIGYRLKIFDLAGGHSGVDINKDIPNAIKEAINTLIQIDDVKIVNIQAGERSNSIPKSAMVEFYTTQKLDEYEKENISLESIELEDGYIEDKLLELLEEIHTGVIEYNLPLNCVESSQNLAIVTQDSDTIKIVISQRSMDNKKLEQIELNESELLAKYGYDVESCERYSAWEPKESWFVEYVQNEYKKFYNKVDKKSIHAGLECSVFAKMFEDKEIVSIGPNIHYPHSINEIAEIKSISNVFEVVKSIVDNLEQS